MISTEYFKFEALRRIIELITFFPILFVGKGISKVHNKQI